MRKVFSTLAVLLLLAVIAAPPAQAAGTLAGTSISNQAYADYKDANGNDMTRVFSNTVTVTVSQVAAVAIDPATGSQAVTMGQTITYLVQLFNHGNAPDSQTFSYATSGAWSPLPADVKMYYDINNDHVYNAGDVLLTETAPGSQTYKTVNNLGAAVLIAADDDYDVIMEIKVPGAGLTNGQSNVITVTTKSDFDNTKTATGTYTTTVQAAALAAVKTHTPAGSPTYLKPGDTITYTITLTNSGSSPATAVTVTDPIPANLTYKPGTILVNIDDGAGFVAKTDAADADGVKYDAGTKSVIANGGLSVLATKTWAIKFEATVNAGTTSGGAVTNQASISYTSGTYSPTVQTNGDTFLVSTLASVDLSTTDTNKTGNPGDQIAYKFTATNNGNANDKINLTVTSTQGWTWAIWADVDGNGIPGTDGDFLLTDTNADGKVDTNTLALNGGSIALLAVATIPVGAANGTTDTITISGASVNDPTKTDTQAFTTTVKAPVLSVTKALTYVTQPAGIAPATCTPTNTATGAGCSYYPGSVLTYQVTATNSGAGNATTVVITDLVPTHTTYKAGTIKTGSSTGSLTARTDATDGDGGRFDSGANAVIVGGSGNLTIGPAGTWVLEFQVTVN
ncbi:MAG TPA: isopeptide-forming domain-containing fimbrial protein [Syntrophales bacterium]|nr:isopeptide-forming domain-containing fimbrial protein [Syntrophales bacterium]